MKILSVPRIAGVVSPPFSSHHEQEARPCLA